ncbi:hypothetical protein F2Q70_00036541 [Brassica cretica]|uniref:Uncharacterized protein n=1 Tax=Brassica cretica TaxID=69181 RepID=A0A8S9JYA0_BRACR|nr:hypothetical protein F2Q70_00036541 [Brassica cretica]
MGLSEVSLCWCQGEVCEAGSGQGRILRWWRLFKGFSDLLFGLVSIRSGGVWCLGWTLPVCFCAQSPLLVIAGGFFLCSQRQTRGSSVSLGFRVQGACSSWLCCIWEFFDGVESPAVMCSRYLSSLSQQLQINRFFSNKARLRLGGSAWSHVQLSVREGCKLGGPRKLCS